MVQAKKVKKSVKPDLQQQVDKVLLEIKNLSNKASAKYKTLDAPTKKKIVAGVGLLAALIAGARLFNKTKKGK
jgi:HrpA-like RNA helicase